MMIKEEPAAPDGSPAWLAARKHGIGGSDAAAIFGCHPWMSPWVLFMDKTVGLPAREYNAALEVGHALEPMTRRLFTEDSGRTVDPSSFTYIPEAHPWMRGNIDGHVINPDASGLGVFEGKTTNPFGRHDWDREGAPLYYLVQLHHYMICTGRTWGTIAVLVLGTKDPLLWQDVELDTEFAEMLVEQERLFWHNHVMANLAPEVDAHPATTALLNKLHPDDSGVTVQLPDHAAAWAEKRLELLAHQTEVKAETDLYTNRLKELMGDATIGELPTGQGFSWKTQERKAYSAKASKSRVFRFHKTTKAMSKAKAAAEVRLAELMEGMS